MTTAKNKGDEAVEAELAKQKKIDDNSLKLTAGQVLLLRVLVSFGIPHYGGEGGEESEFEVTWEDLKVAAESLARKRLDEETAKATQTDQTEVGIAQVALTELLDLADAGEFAVAALDIVQNVRSKFVLEVSERSGGAVERAKLKLFHSIQFARRRGAAQGKRSKKVDMDKKICECTDKIIAVWKRHLASVNKVGVGVVEQAWGDKNCELGVPNRKNACKSVFVQISHQTRLRNLMVVEDVEGEVLPSALKSIRSVKDDGWEKLEWWSKTCDISLLKFLASSEGGWDNVQRKLFDSEDYCFVELSHQLEIVTEEMRFKRLSNVVLFARASMITREVSERTSGNGYNRPHPQLS